MKDRELMDKILNPRSVQDIIDTVPNSKTILEPYIDNGKPITTQKKRTTKHVSDYSPASIKAARERHIEERKTSKDRYKERLKQNAYKIYQERLKKIDENN